MACHSPSEEVHSQVDTEWESMPLVSFLPSVTAPAFAYANLLYCHFIKQEEVAVSCSCK